MNHLRPEFKIRRFMWTCTNNIITAHKKTKSGFGSHFAFLIRSAFLVLSPLGQNFCAEVVETKKTTSDEELVYQDQQVWLRFRKDVHGSAVYAPFI